MIDRKPDGNIILIGMPGTGKTTVGKLLSEFSGYNFIDTDSLINCNTGKTPRQIVEEKGREYFMSVQDEAVLNINACNCVIATGGGLVHSETAMNFLKGIGKVIYLQTGYQIIKDRMDASRKLLRTGGTLLELYNERTPLYNKYADMVIECDNKNPQMICNEITEILKN